MIKYFDEKEIDISKKQLKNKYILFFSVLLVYIISTVILFLIYRDLPYKSDKIAFIKIIQYSLTSLFIIFSLLIFGIPIKRVRKYYKKCMDIVEGIKEQSTAQFVRYEDNLEVKDGVDFKCLIFSEWNKFKKEFYERKVLVFYEKPFPNFIEKQNVHFITQGNVLYEYEIID